MVSWSNVRHGAFSRSVFLRTVATPPTAAHVNFVLEVPQGEDGICDDCLPLVAICNTCHGFDAFVMLLRCNETKRNTIVLYLDLFVPPPPNEVGLSNIASDAYR